MKVREITSLIEAFAPLSLQESYDNSGLIVGRDDDEVHGVLLAVDVTEEVIAEAVSEGCDMIITHHPIIFHALKRFNSASQTERCVEETIRRGIVLYAAHTNLDSTPQGMSWRVGTMIGLEGMRVLEPQANNPNVGFGVVGELAKSEDVIAFMRRVGKLFDVKAVRHSDIPESSSEIRRVAICTGSGHSLIGDALRVGADVYITGDLKYNDFMLGENRMILMDIGHFESEFCAINILDDVLSKKLCNFAVRKSVCSRSPIHYLL